MLLLKCPKCGNNQKYQPAAQTIDGKRKRCVYCGFSFGIRKAIIKEV